LGRIPLREEKGREERKGEGRTHKGGLYLCLSEWGNKRGIGRRGNNGRDRFLTLRGKKRGGRRWGGWDATWGCTRAQGKKNGGRKKRTDMEKGKLGVVKSLRKGGGRGKKRLNFTRNLAGGKRIASRAGGESKKGNTDGGEGPLKIKVNRT